MMLTLAATLLLLPPAASTAADEPIIRTGPVSSNGPLAVGRPFPLFTAADVEGKELSIADLKGRTVLLDFGSIFCGECQAMAKEMTVLQGRHARDGLVIVMVVGGSQKEEAVRNFFRTLKAPYRAVFDRESALFDRYAITQIPFQVVVDRDGIIRAMHAGRPADTARDLGLDALLRAPAGK
jgi:peroxiredoxin